MGDQVLLHGSTRTTQGNGVLRNSVLLDEALLDHHHRLGRNHVVGSGAEDIARRGGHSETETQGFISRRDRVGDVDGVRRRVASRAETRRRTTNEVIEQLPVPSGAWLLARWGPRVADGIAGVVQDRDAIDGFVDRARLDAHDVIHRGAVDRGGCGHICRQRTRRQRQQGAGSGAIEPLVFGRRQARARGGRSTQTRGLGFANPRPLVRPEHLTGDRAVHHLQGSGMLPPALPPVAHGDPVLPFAHAADQSGQLGPRGVGAQLISDIHSVELHRHITLACVLGQPNLHHRVAAADQVWPGRQDANLPIGPRVCWEHSHPYRDGARGSE